MLKEETGGIDRKSPEAPIHQLRGGKRFFFWKKDRNPQGIEKK
jgi:hypothetical protein